jgi:hypothetical protein
MPLDIIFALFDFVEKVQERSMRHTMETLLFEIRLI